MNSCSANSISLDNYADKALVGQNIMLRPLQESDLGVLSNWWNSPRWMVMQQEQIFPSPSMNCEEMFKLWSSNNGASGFGYTIIDSRDHVVGHITIWGAKLPTRIGTLGIIIGPEYVDMGYGSEAIRIALNLAFEELALNKVELQTWSFNERGLHVYSKLGFVEEGRRRCAVFHNGDFFDQILLGILYDEYK